jgi:hypothetical protein
MKRSPRSQQFPNACFGSFASSQFERNPETVKSSQPSGVNSKSSTVNSKKALRKEAVSRQPEDGNLKLRT